MKICLLICSLFLLGACASKSSKNSLNKMEIEKSLKKGVTTQEQVLEIFGSPNVVTTNSSGQEIWSYIQSSSQSSDKSIGLGAISWLAKDYMSWIDVGGGKSETSTQNVTLNVYFSKKHILQSFQFQSQRI